jgi:PleD family two-component response regulator
MLYDAIIMSQTVISVVDDMFFASKIRAVAEAAGVEISFPRSVEAVVSKARETKPGLIVVDLHNQRIDPVALAQALKSDEELSNIKLLGFFSHVQTELKMNALSAGFDEVIPRSVFARDLPEILAAD